MDTTTAPLPASMTALVDLVHWQAIDALEAARRGDRDALVKTVERCPDAPMLAGVLAVMAMRFATQVGRPDRRIAELRALLVADLGRHATTAGHAR